MRIQGYHLPVFSLRTIDIYMDGYYMDAAFNVISTKGFKPMVLTGSRTPSGRYYTMNKRTYRADSVNTRARAHRDFAKETSLTETVTLANATAVAKVGNPMPVGRTKSAASLVNQKGFMLASVGPSDRLIFGTDPVFHLEKHTAVTEAERIASLKPGQRVLVLQVVGSVVSGGTKWD